MSQAESAQHAETGARRKTREDTGEQRRESKKLNPHMTPSLEVYKKYKIISW